MQIPPLTFSDFSLLLAVEAIIFLITVVLASSSYGRTNFTLNKKKLRRAALTLAILSLVTMGIRVVGMTA